MNSKADLDHIAKLILRLALGGMMLFHGVAKFNMPTLDFIKTQLDGVGLPSLLAYGVFLGEVLAPALIILGIYSRVGGFLIFINMVLAIFLVHTNEIFALTEHGGWQLELQAFYLLGGLLVLLLGSGKFAIRPD